MAPCALSKERKQASIAILYRLDRMRRPSCSGKGHRHTIITIRASGLFILAERASDNKLPPVSWRSDVPRVTYATVEPHDRVDRLEAFLRYTPQHACTHLRA